MSVLPGYGVATMCHPWPIVAFVAVQATQPLHPSGRALVDVVVLAIKGWDTKPRLALTWLPYRGRWWLLGDRGAAQTGWGDALMRAVACIGLCLMRHSCMLRHSRMPRHSRVGGNPEWQHVSGHVGALAFAPLAPNGIGAGGEGRLPSRMAARVWPCGDLGLCPPRP